MSVKKGKEPGIFRMKEGGKNKGKVTNFHAFSPRSMGSIWQKALPRPPL